MTQDLAGNDAGVLTHPKFRMWLRPDGIVHMVLAPATILLLEDALAATEAVASLTGGRRSPLLVDVHAAGQTDRAARLELARQTDLVSAVAAIVGSPLSRVMGNLIMQVGRPQMPFRLFDDEASAVAWLQTFGG